MLRHAILILSSCALALAGALATGCAMQPIPGHVSIQPISKWEATQIGAQSMNQTTSWEPNVIYDTKRIGGTWQVTGYKTRGKEWITNKPILEPGVYRVVTLSQYGKVIDFWRVEPKMAANVASNF